MDYLNYYKGCLEYNYSEQEQVFKHNLSKDFHLFMIWEGGLSSVEDVVKNLTENFDILFRADIQWSKEKIPENISRFYKIRDKSLIAAHCKNKARNGKFHCIVVEDKNPKYNYRQNVSGPIRLVNTNNLAIKRDIRNEMSGNFLHSSSCPEEFYEQIYLLFDSVEIDKILQKQLSDKIYKYNNDLIGSNGWTDLKQYFSVLNKCSNYLVQRSYHNLIESIEKDEYGIGYKDKDKDIDMICSEQSELLLASNAFRKKFEGFYVYYFNLNGTDIRIDIENCLYDSLWVKHLLNNKIYYEDGFYIPALYDYFFVLIYHESIIKKHFKKHHQESILQIANKLDFDFFSRSLFENSEEKAKLISGYMIDRGYKVMKPSIKERKYHYSLNSEVLKYMNPKLVTFRNFSSISLYRNVFPKSLRSSIPVPLKKFVKKAL